MAYKFFPGCEKLDVPLEVLVDPPVAKVTVDHLAALYAGLLLQDGLHAALLSLQHVSGEW